MNTILVFDLDNTLYPYQSGLYTHINERMNCFIAERLCQSLSEVDRVRTRFIQQYGTTQEGLSKHYGISPQDFLAYAHDIQIESFIQPNHCLKDLMKSIPFPKYLFSNSPLLAIQRVLTHLEIDQFFSGLISIETSQYIGKPNPSSFQAIIKILPEKCDKVLFFDDEPKNIEAGKVFGWHGVWVNGKQYPPLQYYEDYLIPLIKESVQ